MQNLIGKEIAIQFSFYFSWGFYFSAGYFVYKKIINPFPNEHTNMVDNI